MLSFSKTAKKYVIITIGVAFAGILAGYYLVSYRQMEKEFAIPQEVSKQDNKIKILSNTELVQKILYTKCGDEEVLHTKPPDNIIGLSYQQVQNVYTGWNIEKFDTDAVELTIKVDSFCREHANNTFIGIKDGYVAIFYGKPGPKAILKEVTKISILKLIEQDQSDLKRGVPIQSKEELLKTLEGLQSR